MVERFVSTTGTISVATNASVVVGNGTLFSGSDRAAAKIVAYPAGVAPVLVGTVAEIDPPVRRGGSYDNLALPLVTPYKGAPLVNVPYELVDGPALASGATQVAIYARYAALLEQNAGLAFNSADTVDMALVPNNSLFVDRVTRTVYQYRNGVLDVVKVIGDQWRPMGAYDGDISYDRNDLVEEGNFLFVSNNDENQGHAPDTSPASDEFWTFVPLPGVGQMLAALGVNHITISDQNPSGGQDGDLWFKVA